MAFSRCFLLRRFALRRAFQTPPSSVRSSGQFPRGESGAHGSPSRCPASFISHTQARAPVRAFLDSKWSSVSCDAKARSLLWPPASQGWHLSPGLRHLSRVISLKRNSGTSLSPWVLEAALWWWPSPQGVRVKLRFCVSRARAARTAEVAGAARSSPL